MDVATAIAGAAGLALMAYQYKQKADKPTSANGGNIGHTLRYVVVHLWAGVLVVIGGVLIVLMFTWPLGVALIAYAGTIPQKLYKEQLAREIEADNEHKVKEATPEITKEDDLPWII